jgi:hypothetical protein
MPVRTTTVSIALSTLAAIGMVFLLVPSCKKDGAAILAEPAVAAASPTAADYVAIGAKADIGNRKPEHAGDLHNVFTLSPHVISGSEPETESSFATLKEMGVKTIVSVDSKAPDVDLAAKYGIRYVHVPIGYNGIGAEEQVKLAKTYREATGPFYVHCFHGEHRGPAAAAIGRILLDDASHEQALGEMYQWCGTSKNYSGLYDTVGKFQAPSEEVTKALAWNMPAKAEANGMVEAMIGIGRAESNMKRLDRRGFKPDPVHPDVDALNEATKLVQLFEAALKGDDVAAKSAELRKWLQKSTSIAQELRSAIHDFRAGEAAAAGRASDTYKRLKAGCVDCHKVYRDHAPVSSH